MGEFRFGRGAVVEHAGKRWRIERVLGPETVLLQGEDGPPVAANPAQVSFSEDPATRLAAEPLDPASCSPAIWAEALRRRDRLLQLAWQHGRTAADIDAIAAELGP